MTHALKARYVFPVAGEPIADGVVAFDGERIISVGPASAVDCQEIEDLGNVAILPGLINAHTHLEFSHLDRPIGEQGMPLSRWIDELTRVLRIEGRAPDDAVRQGLEQCERNGVTGLGEIAQPGRPMEDFQNARVDATVFLELIAPTDDEVDEKLRLAHQHIAAGRSKEGNKSKCLSKNHSHPMTSSSFQIGSNWLPGISPHAPYSVHPRLLSEAVTISARHQVPLAIHLAESPEELEFLKSAGGPFRDMLERLGKWEAPAHPAGRRPLDFLRLLAGAHRVLIIHGNYLSDEEIAFIADHADRMSVVYCPRTHRYFGHATHPLEKLLAAGVNVVLGTDSRASSPDLSLLSEMRFLAHSRPSIPPAMVLRMGTLSCAKALGREKHFGTIEPGKLANLCIIPLPDRDASDPHHLIIDQNAPVRSTWFAGRELS